MASTSKPVVSCLFPGTEKDCVGPKRPLSVKIELQQLHLLQKLSDHKNGEALSAVIRAAWALLLRSYTGVDEVLFGFEATGNPPRIAAMESAINSENLVPALSMQLQPDMSLGQLLQHAEDIDTILTTPNDQTHQYNTSVLVRFGVHAAVSGEHQVPKTFVMSEKVRHL